MIYKKSFMLTLEYTILIYENKTWQLKVVFICVFKVELYTKRHSVFFKP